MSVHREQHMHIVGRLNVVTSGQSCRLGSGIGRQMTAFFISQTHMAVKYTLSKVKNSSTCKPGPGLDLTVLSFYYPEPQEGPGPLPTWQWRLSHHSARPACPRISGYSGVSLHYQIEQSQDSAHRGQLQSTFFLGDGHSDATFH